MIRGNGALVISEKSQSQPINSRDLRETLTGALIEAPNALLQFISAWIAPLVLLRLVWKLYEPKPENVEEFRRPWIIRFMISVGLVSLPSLVFGSILIALMLPRFLIFISPTGVWFSFAVGLGGISKLLLWLFILFLVIAEYRSLNAFRSIAPDLPAFKLAIRWRTRLEAAMFKILGSLFVLALSLLPLSALLVALPAVSPNEAVLSDTVPPARTFGQRLRRRIGGVAAGFTVVAVLFAFAIEVVSVLPFPEKGRFGVLSQKVFGFAATDFIPDAPPREIVDGKTPPTSQELVEKRARLEKTIHAGLDDPIKLTEATNELASVNRQIEELTPLSPKLQILLNPQLAPWLGVPLWKILPTAFVQHWPFVLLIMYATDLGLLLLIGRVPIAYNLRNLVVRWRIAGLTAVAFTVVVGLLVALLAFVNGMYQLNESTGVPGNVFVLSDGATDELFSNLGYGDVDNVARVEVILDSNGAPLPAPVHVRRAVTRADGTLDTLPPGKEPPKGQEAVLLASKEIYFVVSQQVPVKEGMPPRRRLVSMRAVDDPLVAGAVHNIKLAPGGQWFSRAGVEEKTDASGAKKSYIQCVIGEGVAGFLGEDAGKPRLEAGDTFSMGDMDWIVVGIMNAEGTTFGSEVWVQNIDRVTRTFGKKGNYTTLVLRTDRDNIESARAMAYHLQQRYTQQKLKAFAEPEYYAELTKTNDQFLQAIVAVALIMAVGGVFGVMNTMFASIAARIREVGVLRILGFKRWQILISFMLESLLIATIGGSLGCLIGCLANGYEARSQLSGGMGGGKGVSLKMIVDYQTVAAGMLFTLVMGRLGGLVPALSAMRMEILDSLR